MDSFILIKFFFMFDCKRRLLISTKRKIKLAKIQTFGLQDFYLRYFLKIKKLFKLKVK